MAHAPIVFAGVLTAATACAGFGFSSAQDDGPPVEQEAATPIHVGVFDSRAVAIAYAASEFNEAFLSEVRKRHEQAKEAGDESTMQAIDAEMQARQHRFHLMGFSTTSVTSLLESIADQLPAIAEAEGVDLLVSRWDVAYQHPDAVCIDVTDAIVQPFEPDARALEHIRQIKLAEPVSEEELGDGD